MNKDKQKEKRKQKHKEQSPQKHRLDHDVFRVAPDKPLRLADTEPGYTAGVADKQAARAALLEDVGELAAAQSLLWANSQKSLLIIFQAMDAAGKDGAIKHVMSGVNPQGVDVHSFRAPNEEELLHHFLWRPMQKLPGRGRIAIFNRSYYEEVLVVRVHPQFLQPQRLGLHLDTKSLDAFWQSRYQEIRRFEEFAIRTGITIVKFFLNVSKQEQRERFVERLENPEKNWKFSAADLRERRYWDEYQQAYEQMLNATSTAESPWYVIPADHKWFARAAIADIIVQHIAQMKLQPPRPSPKHLAELQEARLELGL